MGKMNELALELQELKRCGETLISVAETLTQLFSTEEQEPEQQQEAEPQPQPENETPEKTFSFTEIRGILAQCSRNGHTAAVKDLLHKYGVDKLSDLAPEHYAAIARDAEAL